ncbi:MAG: hypothetical protein JXQ72_09105 [Anaerolineae bacterium]|nr:hypothetical protein [Anaerolineae bacterium]
MIPLTIIDNQYATLRYYPDMEMIHHSFHRDVSDDEFYTVVDAGVTFLVEHGVNKWLSDNRYHSALDQTEAEYPITEWVLHARQTGGKFWALVVPPSAIGRMSQIEFTSVYARQGLRAKVFIDPNAAMEWLLIQ